MSLCNWLLQLKLIHGEFKTYKLCKETLKIAANHSINCHLYNSAMDSFSRSRGVGSSLDMVFHVALLGLTARVLQFPQIL